MKKLMPGQQNYFEAFIKAAQYLAGLTAQQDIWSETGKMLVNFFGAEVGALEERRANAEAAMHRWAFSERYSSRTDLEAETREGIAEVLESGFLSARIIFTPDTLSIACFPITRENQVVAVMVVGHGMPEPLPRELLNVYLAVAGLVGTTVERLASERERKRTEQALSESEALFRTSFENATVGICLVGIDGKFLNVNRKLCEILGYTNVELGQMHFNDITYSEDKDIGASFVRRALAGEIDNTDFEKRYLNKNGQIIWAHVSSAIIRNLAGKPQYFITHIQDITERKTAEEALCQLNKELDRRVLDRTVELEGANKELEAFAYSVSHDLRAPLRHIDGFLELLEKKAGAVLDEQSRHYMDTISDAAKKMGLLIDDLLSFSRMGRQLISFQQVDLGHLVRDVIRELEPDTAGRNIDWRIGDLPVVSGDEAMLRTVLVNLISNALKFTRPRHQARIEIGSQLDQNSEAVIFVRDNGVGFDMTYADKLFGVFQRLHRSDEFEGTGIGLANVHRIIARHGGCTWAEGKPDQGATFYFAVPQTLQGSRDE